MKKNKIKYHLTAGVILIICGTLALLTDYIKEKRDVVFGEMNLVLSSLNMEEKLNNEEEILPEEEVTEEEEVNTNYTYEEYLGIIDIPKIGLYRGFYNKNSNLNNVKFNLYVLPESTYPDTDKGSLIIAGHSGNYNNSYFANLYKLEKEDNIIIHYNNQKYIYTIADIYNEEKTGTVRIIREKEKTTLVLITCTKDDNYHQTIYIAYLTNIE